MQSLASLLETGPAQVQQRLVAWRGPVSDATSVRVVDTATRDCNPLASVPFPCDTATKLRNIPAPLTNSSGARWSSCIDRRSQYLRSSSTSAVVSSVFAREEVTLDLRRRKEFASLKIKKDQFLVIKRGSENKDASKRSDEPKAESKSTASNEEDRQRRHR